MEVHIRFVKSIPHKGVALFVAFVLSLIGLYVGALLVADTSFGASTEPNPQLVRPLAKPCKTVPAAKWNRWRAREIAADGRSRQKKTRPVCVDTFRDFKRHVLKVERGPCWKKGVKCWIVYAAKKFGIDPHGALRLAYCESSFNPNTEYKNHHGLFQFLPSTFATTPYAGKDIYSPKWNSLAAMWLVRKDGGWRQWACKP